MRETEYASANYANHFSEADKRQCSYKQAWAAVRIDPTIFGLESNAVGPKLLDSGILVLHTWKTDRARVTLYRRHDGAYGVRATFPSGKGISARLSELDIPPFLSTAEYCSRAAKHGFLRLRQPKDKSSESADTQVEPEEKAQPVETVA